jgi:predicted nucleic acid-binding protein
MILCAFDTMALIYALDDPPTNADQTRRDLARRARALFLNLGHPAVIQAGEPPRGRKSDKKRAKTTPLSEGEASPKKKMKSANGEGFKLVVSTITLAEYLVGVEPSRHAKVTDQFNEWFLLKPFDAQAASIAARLWKDAPTTLRKQYGLRSVFAADVKIIATAKAAGAERFYSHDKHCRLLASAVMDARDLPSHSEDLFDDAESRGGKRP